MAWGKKSSGGGGGIAWLALLVSLGDLEPEEVARMRESLARSFGDASEGTRRGWRELDSDLERLQGQLREGSSRAKETLDSAVEKMKRVGD